MSRKGLLAVVVSLLLVYAGVVPARPPAAVGTIQAKGRVEVNGVVLPAEGTLYADDRIVVGKDAAGSLKLAGRDQVFLPELSVAAVRRAGERLRVVLEQGSMAVVSRAEQPLQVQALGAQISAAGGAAIFEVAVHGRALEVLSRQGTALVVAAERTVEVPAGMKLEATMAPAPVNGLSAFDKFVLVTAVGLGVAGFALALATFLRDEPEECRVVGSATPFTISCP
jgi:hypothetical protein